MFNAIELEAAAASLPEGCGLLVINQLEHSDGQLYITRVYAVPFGRYSLRHFVNEAGMRGFAPNGYLECWTGRTPFEYTFLETPGLIESFILPAGSLEFVQGEWATARAARFVG